MGTRPATMVSRELIVAARMSGVCGYFKAANGMSKLRQRAEYGCSFERATV